jgi:hypothetical protein
MTPKCAEVRRWRQMLGKKETRKRGQWCLLQVILRAFCLGRSDTVIVYCVLRICLSVTNQMEGSTAKSGHARKERAARTLSGSFISKSPCQCAPEAHTTLSIDFSLCSLRSTDDTSIWPWPWKRGAKKRDLGGTRGATIRNKGKRGPGLRGTDKKRQEMNSQKEGKVLVSGTHLQAHGAAA